MSISFGSRDLFAVEFELLPGELAGGTWMFGKCCYWVANHMIGNYELGTSLRDVLLNYHYIIGDNGKRDGGKFCGLPTDEIYDTIEGLMYRDDIPPNSDRYTETAARFSLTPSVDVFDGYRVYCLSCAGAARVIYSSPNWPGIREAKVPIEIVESSILRFYRELDDIYEKTLAKERGI